MIKIYFQKLLSFFRIRSRVDGLEVSDQAVRLIYFEKKAWHKEGIRLPPGVLENGKIKDQEVFVTALRELKSRVPSARGKNKKLNIFVALSSVNMYSQVFTLPFMEEKDLGKAISLNVQMVSPVDINHAYFSWQMLGRDEKNLRSEIAAAFTDKTVVDEMAQALYSAGFITVGIESRALALVRTLRKKGAGVDPEGSYIVIDIDNSGTDFLIVRKGNLYFEYANPWTDITDDKGTAAVDKFEEMLSTNVRQVLNFYSQHWPEPVTGIVLSAVAYRAQAEEGIRSYTTLPIIPFTLAEETQIPTEWFVAFGCALHAFPTDPKDKEINLAGSGAMDTFHEERITDFLTLWRVLVPAVLVLLLLVYALAGNFLSATQADIESSSVFIQQQGETAQITALEASSTAFNQTVALIENAESRVSRNDLIVADINAVAAANGITITHISFQAASSPILIAGIASAETQIAAFRGAIQNDPHFASVNLPLLNIQGGNGSYTFSMTVTLSPAGF